MHHPNPRAVHRSLAVLISLGILLLAPAAASAERIVALGDVHGSFDGLTAILRTAGLVDEELRWIGGDAILVQTGDLMDRGAGIRNVFDLLIDLETQAEEAGGRLVALLGNHEVNNLVGFRDGVAMEGTLPTPIYATFVDADSETRRARALKQWTRWQRRYPACTVSSKQEWLDARPPGYFAYVESLAPEGKYGRWVRRRPVVAKIGDTVFLHGGLSPALPELFEVASLEQINAAVAAEIAQWDADRTYLEAEGVVLPFSELAELYCALQYEIYGLTSKTSDKAAAHRQRLEQLRDRMPTASTWLSFSGEGPLWFRGFAQWSDEEGPALLDRVVELFGARRFVVGHTPQITGIVARFDRRVLLIDTAMVFGPSAGGRPSALELADGEIFALYRDQRVAVTTDSTPSPSSVPQAEPIEVEEETEVSSTRWLDPNGRELPFTSPEQVRDFLAKARVLSVDDIPIGVTKPKRLLLDHGGNQSRAAFRYVDVRADRQRLSTGKMVMFFRDSYINEVAAYELARMLGLDNIPPAVIREVDNQKGSVQMWVENAIMDNQRRADSLKPPDQLHFNRQFYDMRVFDNLINNVDRNQGNILYDQDWKLWMIDHTRSFNRDKRLPAPNDVIQCSRGLWERLKALDESEVLARLSPYVTAPEARALLVRRERLIELIEEKIARQGEQRVLFDYGDPRSSVAVSYDEIDVPPAPVDGGG